MPFQLPAVVPFRGRSLIALGRLNEGVTRDQAQAEMAGVFAQLRHRAARLQHRMDDQPGAAARTAGRRHPAGGARAVRCCRRRVADRLRQHRQPGADARVRTPPRAGDPIGHWRGHRSAVDAAGLRIADAIARRRSARHPARDLDPERADDVGRLAPAAPAALASVDRSGGARLRRDGHDRNDAGLRAGSGHRRHRRLAGRGAARWRAERVRIAARTLAEAVIRDGGNRAGADRVVRRGIARPKPGRAAERQARVHGGFGAVVARVAAAAFVRR